MPNPGVLSNQEIVLDKLMKHELKAKQVAEWMLGELKRKGDLYCLASAGTGERAFFR